MVGAAGVIAERLGGKIPEENGTGGRHAGEEFAWIGNLQDQVLGCVAIGNFYGFGAIGGDEDAAALQGQAGGVAARENGNLLFKFGEDALGEFFREGDEHDLRIRTVFGLREQVGCDEGGGRAIVGDDEDFGGAGRQIDGGAGGIAGNLELRLGDKRVARAEKFIAFRNGCGAVGEGGDGLGAADFKYVSDAAELGGE